MLFRSKPIDAGEYATVEEAVKQFNIKLAGLQKHIANSTAAVSEKIEKAAQEKEQQTIQQQVAKFAETHPEMKQGSDVVAMMEQLYAKGNTDLEDIYKKACIASDVKPIEVKDGKSYNMSSGNEISDDGKELEKKTTTSSLRSDLFSAETEDLEDGDLKKDADIEGKSVREIAEGNWNEALADAGIAEIPD